MTDLGEICEPARARRPGGRSARVAMRAAPLADDVRPVRRRDSVPGTLDGEIAFPDDAPGGEVAARHEALAGDGDVGHSRGLPDTPFAGDEDDTVDDAAFVPRPRRHFLGRTPS